MSYNLTAKILDIPKLIKIHIHTRNKPGATILFKIKIALLISTKNVDTDR